MSDRLDLMTVEREPSARLSLVTNYFRLTGGISAAAISVLVLNALMPPRGLDIPTILDEPLLLASALATTGGLLWTGYELRERRRTGWYGALFTGAAGIISALTRPGTSWLSLLVGVIGIALVVSVRDELN